MIQRIEALNYRSLRYISQEVKPFQVLVGPNATGKSTFLDVPALMGEFLREGIDRTVLFGSNGHGRASRIEELFFNQQGSQFELALELLLPQDVRPPHTELDTARYEVHIGRSSEGELLLRSESLRLFDRSQGSLVMGVVRETPSLFPSTVLPPPHLRTKRASSHERSIIQRSEEAANNRFTSERGSWSYSFKTSPRRSVLANVPEDMEKFPAALWVRDFLLEGIQTIALNGQVMRRPVSPSAARDFQVDGSNLPLVVRELFQKKPEQFRAWIAHLKTILKGLKTITIAERTDDRHLYLTLSYDGLDQPVPSWLVSDGTLRVLALTLLAYLDTPNRVYLIEEPENGIHPKAIEGVFESLSSLYEGQVLLATHSPLLLKLAQKEQLLCFAKTENGATDIISGEHHPKLRQWSGKIDLDTLFVAGVLG